jgi:hypothetical protein
MDNSSKIRIIIIDKIKSYMDDLGMYQLKISSSDMDTYLSCYSNIDGDKPIYVAYNQHHLVTFNFFTNRLVCLVDDIEVDIFVTSEKIANEIIVRIKDILQLKNCNVLTKLERESKLNKLLHDR